MPCRFVSESAFAFSRMPVLGDITASILKCNTAANYHSIYNVRHFYRLRLL